MAACLSCMQKFHEECENWNVAEDICCCAGLANSGAAGNDASNTGKRDGMAWAKDDHAIRDAKSTGRKRAAKIYPLEPDGPCEWTGLRYAGGGMFPIIGCDNGKQFHRHHGPDLSTLNNTEGNVHRICQDCHNIWHANNDGFIKEFDGSVVWAEHDPDSQASTEDRVNTATKGRAAASRDRFTWRSYNKEKHDYREHLQTKEGSAKVDVEID